MAGYSRGLWVSSVLLVLFGIVSLVLSVVALLLGTNSFGYNSFFGLPLGYMVSAFFIFTTLVGIGQSLYQFIVGLIGINNSNNPSRYNTLYGLGIVSFICALVALVFFAFNMGGGAGSVNIIWNVIISTISAIVSAVFMYCAGRLHSGTPFPNVY